MRVAAAPRAWSTTQGARSLRKPGEKLGLGSPLLRGCSPRCAAWCNHNEPRGMNRALLFAAAVTAVAGRELPRWELSDERPTAGRIFHVRCASCNTTLGPWVWRATAGCEAIDVEGVIATFDCDRAGRYILYVAAPNTGEEYTLLLSVAEREECYEWRLCLLGPWEGCAFDGVARGATATAVSWLTNPRTHPGTLSYPPSAADAALTREVYDLGEQPSMRALGGSALLGFIDSELCEGGDVEKCQENSERIMNFNETLGVWTLQVVPQRRGVAQVALSGRGLRLLGCSASDRTVRLRVFAFESLAPGVGDSGEMIPSSVTVLPSAGGCGEGLGVLVGLDQNGSLLVSQGGGLGFHTALTLLGPDVATTASTILDATLAFGGALIVLTEAGLFAIDGDGASNDLVSPLIATELPSPLPFNRIQGPSACTERGFQSGDELLAWGDTWRNGLGVLYTSFDDGTSFEAISLASALGEGEASQSFRILRAVPLPSHRVVLVQTQSGTVDRDPPAHFLLLASRRSEATNNLVSVGARFGGGETWDDALPPLSSAVSRAASAAWSGNGLGFGEADMAANAAQTGEIFVWGGDIVAYSANGGATMHVLTLRSAASHDSNGVVLSRSSDLMSHGDWVAQVTSTGGSVAIFAVRTARLRIFVGRIGSPDAFEVPSPLSAFTAEPTLSLVGTAVLYHAHLSSDRSDVSFTVGNGYGSLRALSLRGSGGKAVVRKVATASAIRAYYLPSFWRRSSLRHNVASNSVAGVGSNAALSLDFLLGRGGVSEQEEVSGLRLAKAWNFSLSTVSDSRGDVDIVPVLSGLTSPGSEVASCEVLSWQYSLPSTTKEASSSLAVSLPSSGGSHIYLDLGENAVVTAEALVEVAIDYDATSTGGVSALITDRALISYVTTDFTESMDVHPLLGVRRAVRRTRRVKVSLSSEYGRHKSVETAVGMVHGVASVVLEPTNSIACADVPTRSVMRVRVGCPPSRHLRLRIKGLETGVSKANLSSAIGSATHRELDFDGAICRSAKLNSTLRRTAQLCADCAARHGAKYTLEGQPSSFHFDVRRFGCPLIMDYTQLFIPSLEVWDGDNFVRSVPDSEFVLFELNSREGEFAYTQTASSAGCSRPAQTRRAMVAAAAERGESAVDSWTAANYASCRGSAEGATEVEAEDEPDWREVEYEVLRGSGSNAIAFSAYTSPTPLLFRAEVLDAELSFCRLSVEFAVVTTGMPEDLTVAIAIVGSVTLAMLLALAGSYHFYANELRQGKED